MLTLYYGVWADAIIFERKKYGHLRNWKFYTLIPISMIMGLNLFTLALTIGEVFDFWILGFCNINLFPIKTLNTALEGIITLFLPFVVLNYFVVFYKHRYQWITARYPYKKGRVYMIYVLSSLGVIIIPLIILVIFLQ